MKYIITADTRKSWTIGNLDGSHAYVFDDKITANKRWLEMKNNSYFENLFPSKAEDVEIGTIVLLQTKQGEKPLFASAEYNEDVFRLFEQAYGGKSLCNIDKFKYVLPKATIQKMEFDTLGELDPDDYDDEDYKDGRFHSITIVREKKHGCKFYMTERFARYDEILTGREDVCEIRLHPYVSDFNLVKDIEVLYDDYDM